METARAMIDGFYTMYSGRNNKPELIVLTPLAAFSAHVGSKTSETSPCNADKEDEISDVYASVEYLASSHPALWLILVATVSIENTARLLPPRVCCVTCSAGSSGTSSIYLPADCHTAWAALLRETNETIQSPQSLVTLLACQRDLWLAPWDLARLHAECVWLGEHRCAAALLPLLAVAQSRPHGKPTRLQVEFLWRVEALRGTEAKFHADLRLTEAEPSSIGDSSSLLSLSLPPPMRLVVLHPHSTQAGWEQIARLIVCLSARDHVCVCIAGEIVVPISDAPDAQRRMCVGWCDSLKASPTSPVSEMRRMWELAADATSQWHREDVLSRSYDIAMGRSDTREEGHGDGEHLHQTGAVADGNSVRHRSRMAVIFFLPDDCSTIEKASVMSIVRRNPAFFHVPVVCLATSTHIANTHVLLDLCKITHGHVLLSEEGTDVRDDAHPETIGQSLLSLHHYNKMVGSALNYITNLTYYDTSLIVLSSRENPDERWGPLHVSGTFGVEQVVFPHENRSSGTQQLLGPLTTRRGAWVYLCRAWKGRRDKEFPDLSTGGIERTMFSAYNVDTGVYEIVYGEQNKKPFPVPSIDARDWWGCLLYAFQLLCEEQPAVMSLVTNNIIPRTWLYFGTIGDLEGTEYYQREVQPLLNTLESLLPKEYERREFLIVMWILSHLHFLQQPSPNSTQGEGSNPGGYSPSHTTEIMSSSFCTDKSKKKVCLVGDAFLSLKTNLFVVNHHWINFTDAETSFSTLQAIITRTCPYPNDTVDHTTSETLALKKLSDDSAWIDVKSVDRIPSLTYAVERAVILFRVDSSTRRMKFDRRIPDEQLSTSKKSVIEVSNLLPSQRYCLVHFSLRRPAECWVFASDILVADGIVFNTPSVQVNDLYVASVSHNTVELVWKGGDEGNEIKAVRLKLCPFRWASQMPQVTNDDERIVEVNHRYGSRFFVTQLQPCTLYHVTAVPIRPGHGDMKEWESYGTSTELYVATCRIPEKDDLTVQWTPQEDNKVDLLLSYPIHYATAYISPSCGVELCILPHISIDSSNVAEHMAPSTQENYKYHKKEDQVYLSHKAKLSESHLVSVYFEMTLHPTNRPLKGLQSESRVRSEGFDVQIGPFHLSDGIRISSVTPTSVRLQWSIDRATMNNAPLIASVHPLYGATGDVESSQLKTMLGSIDTCDCIIDGLTPSFRYEALLKRNCGAKNTVRVEFSTPPLPPSRSVVSAALSTSTRNFYVRLPPRNPDSECFLTATILPFMERVDNLMMNGFLCASYQDLQPGQPLILSIVNSWVSREGDLLRSAPTYLYAVTDIVCTVCPSGHLKLAWTCAASRTQTLRGVGGGGGGGGIAAADAFAVTPSLSGMATVPTYSMNNKNTDDNDLSTKEDVFLEVVMNDIVRARDPPNIICLEPPEGGTSTPITLRFRGLGIIEEASSIFILPPPPSLNAEVCRLEGQENGLVYVRLAVSFIKLLRDTLDSLAQFVSANLVSSSGKEMRLPLDGIEHEDLQLSFPVASNNSPTIIFVRWHLNNINQRFAPNEISDIPLILTPWPLVSEPFEIYGQVCRPIAAPIVDLRVTELFPTSVTLEWTSLEDAIVHYEACDSVCVIVQCTLQGSDIAIPAMTFFCRTPQLSIDNLTPATPYIISVSRSNESENSASLKFVTPLDITNDLLRGFLGSLLLQHDDEDNERAMVEDRFCSSLPRNQKESLRFLIPRDKKLLIKVSPHCNWYTCNEVDDFGSNSPIQIALRTSFCVDLVSASGEVIQRWSRSDDVQGHEICCFFPGDLSNCEAMLPHLTLRAFSPVWIERSVRSSSESILATISEFNGKSERMVDVIGFPCLSYIAENCFIVEWKGSCEAYHVRWRTGLSQVIHFETMMCGLNQNPRLKINTSCIDIDVFLFAAYSLHHPSNCLAFCVLVPLKPCCIPLSRLPTGGGRVRLPSVSRSDLLEIHWSINVGGQRREALCVPHNLSEADACDKVEMDLTEEELCAKPSFVVTASITDTSSPVWEGAFADILRYPADHCAASLPTQIVWLNPTVSICFPVDM